MINQVIKITHKTLGTLVNETFIDAIQFKIFLQSINGCLVSKSDLDFFNGTNFLLHIPYDVLKESVIVGKSQPETLTESLLTHSMLEK